MSNDEWIPVSERLPKGGRFLVFENGEMLVADYWSSDEIWTINRRQLLNVTHWQPLPEPPATIKTAVSPHEQQKRWADYRERKWKQQQ